MTTIYELTTKIDGKGIHLVKYGYMEAPEAALLLYNMYDLNNENLDFRSQMIKQISEKISINETGEQVRWYEEDLKLANVSITTVNSATEFVISAAGVIVGETLYNQTTQATTKVTAVSGTTITLDGTGDTSATAGDVLVRIGFGKKYGDDHYFTPTRNDLQTQTNYIQYTEAVINSSAIENNKTRLFVKSPEEHLKLQFTDASRKIVKDMAMSFYFGVNSKTLIGSYYSYTAGGLEEFIPSANKVNVQGADDAATKKNIRDQLTAAYQSGLSGIWGQNKLLAFCTTKFMDEIDRLYEDKLVYNDKLTSIDVNITSYSVGGKKLNMVESNILNETVGDLAVAYLVPIDYTFLYNIPYYAAEESGKTLQRAGRGIVYKKPQSTFEKSDIGLGTSYSFMFMGVYSGAYRKLYFA